MTTTSRAARLGLLAFLFAELTACGGGGGGGGSTPPPPPPPPPAATEQSFSPADTATQVDVQSSLTIAFDKSLAPASVTRAHVRLVSQGVPVATRVTYDEATHSVHVDPMGLDYGRSYTLSVTGLVDANGQAVADRHAAFSTWVNAETSGVILIFTNYASTTVSRAQVDTFDASGAPTGYYFSNNAGADGLWSTTDDVIFGGYTTDTYRSDGQLASETSAGAGNDGLWHTGDDMYTVQITRTFLPNGALATDDRFNVSMPNYDGFEAEGFTTYTYNPDGTLQTAITAVRKGADGVWGTADDIIGWSVAYTYDEFGHVVLEQDADLAGPDGIWGTADDGLYAQIKHVYLANGRLYRNEHYDQGVDAQPGAPATVLEEVDTYSYDAANNNVGIVYGLPGEFFGLHTQITYDAHNNRQARMHYDAAGADHAWGTADDRLAVWRAYDVTK